jgi:hypothetical protein
VWPCSRIEATRMVIPFGVMLTPLRRVLAAALPPRR